MSHRAHSPPPQPNQQPPSSVAMKRYRSEIPTVRRDAVVPEGASRALHRRTRSLGESYPATSIDKHYALNQRILGAFDVMLEQQAFQVAYAIGLQFVEMALLEIPKHGYYYSSRHDRERKQNTEEAVRVTQQLQEILQHTDAFDPSLENSRVSKLCLLADEQASGSWDEYERDRVVIDAELKDMKKRQQQHNEKRVYEYMDAGMLCAKMSDSFSEVICPPRPDSSVDDSRMDQAAPEKFALPTDRTSVTKRPSMSSAETDLERALYLSGMEISSSNDRVSFTASSSSALSRPRTKPVSEIDIQTLRRCYHEDFEELREAGRIHINRLDTYQGRLPGSINGCTVIAPLLCLHHFSNYDSADDAGLPDFTLRQVIDNETPALLQDVRTRLGLTKDAFIIPSDVNDFLLDRGMLAQSQFVNVCGGNILDDKHVGEFWKNLSSSTVPKGKRVAATIFFHEHVIAILRLKRTDGAVWHDFIDSLPYEEFLSRHDVVDDDEEREAPEGSLRSMESGVSSEFWGEDSYSSGYIPYAVRVRCVGEEALKATLRWYACCKFNKANRTYIDMYNWDDQHCDFDPRVFQAFVWREE